MASYIFHAFRPPRELDSSIARPPSSFRNVGEGFPLQVIEFVADRVAALLAGRDVLSPNADAGIGQRLDQIGYDADNIGKQPLRALFVADTWSATKAVKATRFSAAARSASPSLGESLGLRP
jgi:hypothetical protein